MSSVAAMLCRFCNRLADFSAIADNVRALSTGDESYTEPPSSSGLGHHPFKVAARVRIPLGVLSNEQWCPTVMQTSWSTAWSRGEVEFTPACQAGGRGFEPRRDRSGESLNGCHLDNQWLGGAHIGRVAQSAEHTPEKRRVTGSTPVSTTTVRRGSSGPRRLCFLRRIRQPSGLSTLRVRVCAPTTCICTCGLPGGTTQWA